MTKHAAQLHNVVCQSQTRNLSLPCSICIVAVVWNQIHNIWFLPTPSSCHGVLSLFLFSACLQLIMAETKGRSISNEMSQQSLVIVVRRASQGVSRIEYVVGSARGRCLGTGQTQPECDHGYSSSGPYFCPALPPWGGQGLLASSNCWNSAVEI